MLDTISIYVLGFATLLLFGASNGLSKVPIDGRGVLRTMLTRDAIVFLLFTLLLVGIFDEVPWAWKPVAAALSIGIMQAYASFNFFGALQDGNVGVVAAVGNSYAVITLTFSTLILKEGMSAWQVFFGLLTVVGVILLSLRPDDKSGKENVRFLKPERLQKSYYSLPFLSSWMKHWWRYVKGRAQTLPFDKGAKKALITMLIWGLMYVVFTYPTRTIGVIPTISLMEISYILSILLVISIKGFDRPKNRFKFNFTQTGFFGMNLLLGLCVAGALFFLVNGLERGQTGLMSVFTGANPVITFLFGALFYSRIQERLVTSQKIGFLLTVGSLILLTLL